MKSIIQYLRNELDYILMKTFMNIPFWPVDPTKSSSLDLEHPKTWFVLGLNSKLQVNLTYFSAV